MVQRRFILYLLIIVFTPALQLRAQSPLRIASSFHVDTTLVITELPFLFSVADSFVVAGSFKVKVNRQLLQPEIDFQVNYEHLILTLSRGAASIGDSLFISYDRLLLPVARINFNRELRYQTPLDDSSEVRPDFARFRIEDRDRRATRDQSNLVKQGSLVRGISIGTNQGLKVDSGLRLEVSGKVADDVEVIAALSDQNIPIQPEGNTQTLSEIDKVFIELKGKHFAATLGDYNLTFAGSEFGRYSRKLQGASFAGQKRGIEFKVFGAVSRGKYMSQQISGREGNQGPYQLTGDRGQIDIIILAGTERIWVDGEKMVRGENNDYIIEYGNGQLTFTRKRLITSASRITADFQYSDERFQRNLTGGEVQLATLKNRLQVKATFLRESDDKDNPLGIVLSDEIKAALAGAGDSQATLDGATFVGAGQGSYQKQDTIFVYVGNGVGDYRVRFSDLGEAQGSYKYSGYGQYDFVGQGNGRYLPVLLLERARKNEMTDLRFDYAPTAALNITGEVAVSNFDNNLYSDQGDDDNRGGAWLMNIRYAPPAMKIFGKNMGTGSLHLKVRERQQKFRELDRQDVVEFGRKWDLQVENSEQGERVTEARIELVPWKGIRFFGSAGMLRLNMTQKETERLDFGTNWSRPEWLDLQFKMENIKSRKTATAPTNAWFRQKGRASRKVGYWRPIVEFENEMKKEAELDSFRTGFRFVKWGYGLQMEDWNNVSATAKFTRREDENRIDQTFNRESTSDERHYSLSLKQWRNFDFSLSYINRNLSRIDSIGSSRTDLAEARMGYKNWNQALQFDTRYQLSNTSLNRQQRIFFKVPQGEGAYMFDDELQEYYRESFGDFILRLVPTDEFIPVVELKSRMHLKIQPKRYFKRKKKQRKWFEIMSALSAESLLRIDEKSRDPEVDKIYFFHLSHFQNENYTIQGAISLRQDLHILENSRKFSMRYRLQTSRDFNDRFLEGGQRGRKLQHAVRMKIGLSKTTKAQVELIQRTIEKRFQLATRVDRHIEGAQLNGDLSFRPRPRIEFASQLALGWDKDRAHASPTRVQHLRLKPRVVYAFRGKGQLRGDFEWTAVSSTPGNRILPYELAQGYRPGKTTRWNLSLSYRVSQNLNATATYHGRNDPNRPRILHVAKVEMRAFF